MININIDRLLDNIKELSKIGSVAGGKVTREKFSFADIQAREWLKQKILNAGLDLYVDGAMNIHGRLKGEAAQYIATGSHIDTVPNAGKLDGVLGVLAGLEILQSVKEHSMTPKKSLEVISFTDEETSMVGSKAIAGIVNKKSVERLVRGTDHVPLNVDDFMSAKIDKNEIDTFIELHVEQGSVLDGLNIPIGLVETIIGIKSWKITIIGQTDHSGATPMNIRKDAFAGLAKFADQVNLKLVSDKYKNTRFTIGKVDLFPGEVHVVAGQCEFLMELREIDEKNFQDVEKVIFNILYGSVANMGMQVVVEPLSANNPVDMNCESISMIENVSQEIGCEYIKLPAFAGHDAQNMADICKSAMIFIPTVHGIRHSKEKHDGKEAVEKGANLLAACIYKLGF